ncbi:calcium-binding protein [Paraburkholderia tropica]|uniref:calcium-binding protein n=1 Tax=Paraburkholderia tropica TaxID=92647 RepID=UPI002AB7B23D|nr:calcium-binding protein [Paraburkholderia tropica]
MKLSINAARPHATGRFVDTIIGACAVFGLIVGLAATPAHAADAVRAMPTSDFIDSLAVNTHVNYTDGAYVNVHNIADDLNWLGIRHVRDIVPNGSPPFDNYVYLARRGVKFNFLVRTNIDESIAQAVALNTAVPGSVAAIEGFNEIDNFPVTYNGLKGAAAGLASQRDIYSRVQTTPALAGVRVYDVTGYDPKGVDTRTSSADYSNTHVYPQNGEQPSYNANGDHWLPAALGSVKKFELPVVVTEFGYFSMPQSGWYMLGVDEPTQAKGVLNGYMDAAAAGVKRLFVYELLDQKPDPQNKNAEMHYGMFRNDNSPKVVAHTIRNLTTILNTNTPHRTRAAARDTLAYTLSGMPVSAYSLLLKKKDGRFVLALWNETPIWDRAKGTPLVSPPVPVQVGLGANARRVDVYDPMVSAEPLAAHRNEGQISVDVPDHPILLEITPAGTPGT